MAQKTRDQIETQTNSTIFTNNNNLIKAQAHNTLLHDFRDSVAWRDEIPTVPPNFYWQQASGQIVIAGVNPNFTDVLVTQVNITDDAVYEFKVAVEYIEDNSGGAIQTPQTIFQFGHNFAGTVETFEHWMPEIDGLVIKRCYFYATPHFIQRGTWDVFIKASKSSAQQVLTITESHLIVERKS